MSDSDLKIPGAWPASEPDAEIDEAVASSSPLGGLVFAPLGFVKGLFGKSTAPAHIELDVLTSLLDSVEGFKQQLASQQNEIDGLKRKQIEQDLNVSKFRFFPKLPLEIRRMIWGYCFGLPRIFSVLSLYRWRLV